jgi:hypothetical protein
MKRLILVLLLASGAARATENVVAQPAPRLPLQLSLDVDTAWHLDQSYRLFSADRSDGSGGFSVALEVHRLAHGTLAIGAGLHGGTDDARLYQGDVQAKLNVETPSLFATLRWPVRRWLQPHVRLAVDGTWGKLTVTAADGNNALVGHSFSPGGSAGAGFSLRTGTLTTSLRGGTLGLAGAFIVEGGFHLGAPLGFDLTRQRPADDKLANDRLPAGSTGVGDLGRSQPYLRLSFALLI